MNWKRTVIAAFWSELLLFAIYIPVAKYADTLQAVGLPRLAFIAILILAFLGPMFLAGLWLAHGIRSRFVMHGILVGITANVIWLVLLPVLSKILSATPGATGQGVKPSLAGLLLILVPCIMKILASAFGAYVGGLWRMKVLNSLRPGESTGLKSSTNP